MLIASLVSSALTCSPLCCRTGWSIIISCQSLFPLRLILKFFCRPEARKPPWQQVTASSSISFWTWWSTPNYIQSHVHSSLQITSRSCWTSFKKSSASFTDAKSWGTDIWKSYWTRLTYNFAHLRSTKESLTIWVKFFRVKIFLSENFLGEFFLGENFFWWKFFLVEKNLWWNFFGWKFFGW